MSGRDLIILARLCPNVTLAVAVLGWFSMRWPGLIVIQNFRFGSAVKLLCLLACVLAAMLKRFCMWSAEAVTQETQFVQDRTQSISMARLRTLAVLSWPSQGFIQYVVITVLLRFQF